MTVIYREVETEYFTFTEDVISIKWFKAENELFIEYREFDLINVKLLKLDNLSYFEIRRDI